MKTCDLQTREPFENLFPVELEVLDGIAQDMAANGYDKTEPICLWEEEGVIVDGHTRRLAAIKAGIQDVAVASKSFESEDDALQYAIKRQRKRRNLTDADYYRIVRALDKKHARGGDRRSGEARSKSPSGEIDPPRRSDKETAKIIDKSPRFVSRVRRIADSGDEDLERQVIANEKKINMADRELAAKKKGDTMAAHVEPNEKNGGGGMVTRRVKPSNAMNLSRAAIRELEMIRDDDPMWVQAIELIQTWIDDKRSNRKVEQA